MHLRDALPLASLAALSFAALSLGACLEPSDRKQDVNDLRILAMKLEPAEVALSLDETAPPREVVATALLVDPARGSVELAFRACPDPGRAGCQESAVDPTDPLYAGLLAERRATQTLPVAPQTPELRPIDRRAFSNATLASLLETAPLGGLAGARPVFELRAFAPDRPGNYELAFKRLQVSYPDPVYRFVLGEIGLALCDGDGLPEGCVDYRTKVPNQNPVIAALASQGLTAAENGDAPVPVPPEGLEVAPGTTIRIHPLIDPDSLEAYQTLGVDFETQAITLNDFEELLVLDWFATTGELALAQTIPSRDFGAFNDFTAPDTLDGLSEPGEPLDLWIWIVLRDNRGGTDFRALHLRVTP